MPSFAVKFTLDPADTLAGVSVATLLRSDTLATPAGVALPLALSLVGGLWVGSFADASPSPYYDYTLALTFGDGSTQTTPTAQLPGALTGIYGTINDIVMEIGKLNADIAADPDNLQDANDMIAHKQQAIDFADSQINTVLQRYKFATPATASLTQLRFIFAKLGAFQLYQIRGLQDAKRGTDGAFQAKFDWAMEQLEELTFMNRGGFARVSGYADAPVGVGPTVESDGSLLRRIPRWNPYGYWMW